MLRFEGNYRPVTGRSVRALVGLVAAAGLLAGGCSSGITRFGYPSGLTETGSSGPPRPRAEGPAGGGYSYAPPAGTYGNGQPPASPYGNGYSQQPPNGYGNGYAAPQSGSYGNGYQAPAGGGYGNGYGAPSYGGYGNGSGAPSGGAYGNSYGAPPPPAGTYGAPPARPYGGVSSAPQSGTYGSNISVAALPKSDGPPRPAPAPVSVMSQPAASTPPVTPVARATPPSAASTGEEIEVHQGDTVYNISRRHSVSMSELIRVNGLTDLNLKPGQKLRLPAGAKSVAKAAPRSQPVPPTAEAPKAAPVTPVVPTAAAPAAAQPVAAAPTAAASAAWTETYTIKAGDSLYSVARRRGVTVAELQRVNGITDARKVMPGAVIKVPPEATESRQAAATAPSSQNASPAAISQATAAAPSVTVGAEPQTAGGPRPTVINAPRVAAVDIKGTTTDIQPVASGASRDVATKQAPEQPKGAASADVKLRWPVKGRVVSSFGPQSDGTQNDGVNVAVPLGTDVLAAESGVVAYAGSEVRGYGNLVLVRHDNGWVTAYAHNDQLLVQRGDRVRRGQSLAKAGRTGSVDQPQLHFELRQGPKPVDPTPYMERM